MNQKDYYIEFYTSIDHLLKQYLEDIEKKNPSLLILGNHYVELPLRNMLFLNFWNDKEFYNKRRKEGENYKDSVNRLTEKLKQFAIPGNENEFNEEVDITIFPWYEILLQYKNQIVFYIFNERQLTYLVPIIREIKKTVLLLSEYDIEEDVDLPETVTALTIEFSGCRQFKNNYIEWNFPLVYHYFNTFDLLMRILTPSSVTVLEGCHYQEKILGVIGKSYDIPTICIQQGWPSFIHTALCDYPYTYFITWGDFFSRLWERYNSLPTYYAMGYLYPVCISSVEEKRYITFFLQSPVYLSDNEYFNEINHLILSMSDKYLQLHFMVREHPEYKLPDLIIDEFRKRCNIEIVTDEELAIVFRKTQISVSHFSSSLMEGVAHGCIPLVYDPTANSRYYPDVEKEGFGLIASDKEEFEEKLFYILNNKEVFMECISQKKNFLFADITGKAVLNVASFIQSV